MTRNKTLATVAVVTGLFAALVTQTAAQADTNAGNTTTLVAVGSDTSQDVMEGLSNVAKDSAGNPLISNYKATPVGRSITTRTGDANCTFTVPRNSGDGVNALSAAMRGASFAGTGTATPVTSPNLSGCVDIARSSSGGNPTTSPGVDSITYIPFATDSVTYATLASSSVPHKLNKNTLKTIYTSNGTPGSAACVNFAPLLPASGSGTRSFFATMLGLTDSVLGSGTANSWGTCVRDTNAGGTAVQEHDGRFLTAGNQLVPFSVSQYVAQTSSTITDIRGNASLGSIDFTSASGSAAAVSPVNLQSSFGNATRSLYNAVATAQLNNAKVAEALVGPNSDVCLATTTIQNYGLALNSLCGDTTKKNT